MRLVDVFTGQETGKPVKSFLVNLWCWLECFLTRLALDAIHFAELSTMSAELVRQQKI